MAKRYYVCDLLGVGTRADPYRPMLAGASRNWVAAIPGNGAVPLRTHCLCLLAALNAVHTTVSALAGVDALPNIPLSQTLTNQQRNNLIARLDNRGMPSGWVVAGITMREVVRTIGRYYFDSLDEAKGFDVADVA